MQDQFGPFLFIPLSKPLQNPEGYKILTKYEDILLMVETKTGEHEPDTEIDSRHRFNVMQVKGKKSQWETKAVSLRQRKCFSYTDLI